MVFWLTWQQHLLLSQVEPALWIQSVAVTHSTTVALHINSNPQAIFKAITGLINSRTSRFVVVSISTEDRTLVLHKFSDLFQFLSRLTVHVQDGSSKSRSIIKISSQSVSALPASFPLCFVWGILLFWLPFPDYDCNQKYVLEIVELIKSIKGVNYELVEFKTSDSSQFLITRIMIMVGRGINVLPQSFIFFFAFMFLPATLITIALMILT